MIKVSQTITMNDNELTDKTIHHGQRKYNKISEPMLTSDTPALM